MRKATTVATTLACLLAVSLAAADGPKPFTSFSAGKADLIVSQQGKDYLRFGLIAWGPKWAWTGMDGKADSRNGATEAMLRGKMGGTGVPFQVTFHAARPRPSQLELDYQLEAKSDTPLTYVVAELALGKMFQGRDVVALSGGKQTSARYPFDRGGLGEAVETVRLTDPAGQTTVLHFDPPCEISSDGAARIVLGKDRLTGGDARRLKITVDLPGATEWYASLAEMPDEPGIADWYAWQATAAGGESLIGMENWIERPAGRHGRITRQGEKLLYNDRPIKLWGVNLCYGTCAPEKELADRRAAFYRKYGINSVRLHKFADGPGWAGIQSNDSFAQYDPEGLDRMDYQVARFKEAGIYVNLSAHFGTLKIGPADKQVVPYAEEFGAPRGGKTSRIEAPHSAVFYSPELQELQIRQIVNLLKHRNPYTGMTYAEDPAVAFVEIVNEQSILFYSSMAPLKASPTLRKQVAARFSGWLRKKYGSQEQLEAAWGGREAFDSFQGDGFPAIGESLEKENLLPLGNPWYWDPEQLAGSQAFRRQRLLDSLEFLYSLQVEFYQNYVKAVREAGYQGEIVGSNWQAGRALSHFANLHADWIVGMIDRHNYFGGRDAGASMLRRAGSGMLSSGMQQVADRPFMLSEWIHVFPSELGVEGPAILGTYGLGLQGWDVSYIFQNRDAAAYQDKLGRDRWEVTTPQVLGVFPAVARQILRGDVRESDVQAVRNVHVPSLFEGKLSFDDRVVQGYDDKELDSSKVPARALAVARCVVDFTDAYQETPVFDMTRYERGSPHMLVSSTGQLQWQEQGDDGGGYFTIDSPGTKAVVGFAQGQKCVLGDVTIEPESPFAAVYVTARDPQGTVDGSRELLVVALARARNTGMKFSPDGAMMLAPGEPPILLEPVKAQITLRRPGSAKVNLLDHDGRLTERTIAVEGGVVTIDGARDKTPYYLIRY